ncbi:hypothetical protein Ocin01_12119 [Orchesella cincta]|uniref:EGF-like domain-containing protein n=1 Tax=Orchesella cincta TaxID=48709 RepID=A0A1D2MNK3_ORCCI|nr:hypothetical protein Ocin01_12119 [Orchesella cincta]
MKHLIHTALLLLALSGVQVIADGSLTYGDKCSVSNGILQIFTQVEDKEKCNLNQGLLCTGTCTCPPTRVWYKGPLFGLFGGGKCIAGANGPCVRGDTCVDNAVCGDNIPLCVCQSGYYAHEGYCVSEGGFKGFIKNISNGSGRVMNSAAQVITVTLFAHLFLTLL